VLSKGISASIRAAALGWWRVVAVQVLLTAAVVAVLVIAGSLLLSTADGLAVWLTAVPELMTGRMTGVASGVVAGVVVLSALPLLAASAATVVVADRTFARARPSVARALAAGVRSTARLLLSAVIAVAAVLLAAALAPVLTVIGLLGLLLTAARGPLRRWRPTVWSRWPAPRFWIVIAVPFGALWWVAAPAVLVLPAAVLERAWPALAIRSALTAAATGRWRVLAGALAATVVAFALAYGAFALGTALGGDAVATTVAFVAQLVVMPLPLVVATALYRRAAGPTGRLTAQAPAPVPAPRRAALGARAAAVAIAVALIAPLGVVASAQSAAAVEADADGQTGVILVTSSVDTLERSALDAQRSSCLEAGADCTLRAALDIAEEGAVLGLPSARIRIQDAPIIALVAPLEFRPDERVGTGGGTGGEEPPTEENPTDEPPTEENPGGGETPPEEQPSEETPGEEQPSGEQPLEELPSEEQPSEEAPGGEEPVAPVPSSLTDGVLSIDGGGAVLDGRDATQILIAVSDRWNVVLNDLVLRDGFTTAQGGAYVGGVDLTTIAGTVFEGNTSGQGGGAIVARSLRISASSFIDNQATHWSETVYGGAIRSAGTVEAVNTTFLRSAIGDVGSRTRGQGSDISADGGMSIVNSSFVDFEGGSLRSGAPSTVRNSLLTTATAGSGLFCVGPFTGSTNAAIGGDDSCGGSGEHRDVPRIVAALDRSDPVPVLPLAPYASAAIGAGADCPAVDARGADRAAEGCDLGAVEFDGTTTVTVSAQADSAIHGRVLLRASVASGQGPLLVGAVVFTVDGVESAPVPLDDPDDPIDDTSVAELVVSDLAGEVEYSAAFTGRSPWSASTSATATHVVSETTAVAVRLLCGGLPGTADESAAACQTAAGWRIGDGDTLPVRVEVDHEGPGIVTISRDEAGREVVAGPVAVDDGLALLELVGAELGAGEVELTARYVSDDRAYRGRTAAPALLTVLRSSTVTVTPRAGSAVYGDDAAGLVDVVVTGAGATPTGTVLTFGRSAALVDGRAVLDLSALTPGAERASVSYSGDAAYAPSVSAPVPFETTQASSTVEITGISPSAPGAGQPFTVTATVRTAAPSTADVQSAVRLLIDGEEPAGVRATYSRGADDGLMVVEFSVPSGLALAGAHPLQAVLDGTAGIAGSSSDPSGSVTIGRASTSTIVSASTDRVGWGTSVTLSATVTADSTIAPNGSVAFSADGRDLGSVSLAGCPVGECTATLSVDARELGIGAVAVGARYTGTAALAGSIAPQVSIAVDPAAPALRMTAPTTLGFHEATTLRLELAAGRLRPESAQVVVTAVPASGDPVAIGTAQLSGGSGALLLDRAALAPGEWTLHASFSGQPGFTATTVETALTVTAAPTEILLSSIAASVPYGTAVPLEVEVRTEGLIVPPEGEVVLRWLGREVGRATLTDEHGTAFTGVRRATVVATFGGDGLVPGEAALTADFIGAPGFEDASHWDQPQEQWRRVTVAPLRAQTEISATGVLGGALGAVATVDIPGAVDGIAAAGTVLFVVERPDGTRIETDRDVRLRDGRASLVDAFLQPVVLDAASSWIVRATFHADGADRRYVSEDPERTDTAVLRVDPRAAAITVQAPVQAEDRVAFDVAVTVDTIRASVGTVRVLDAASGEQVGAPVALRDRAATVSVLLPALSSLGTRSLVVEYSGDAGLLATASSVFEVELLPTRVALRLHDPQVPGFVGGTVRYAASVSTVLGAPVGEVRFSRDGFRFASVPVDEDGWARVALSVDAAWAGVVTAEFVPESDRVASSSATIPHTWVTTASAAALTPPTTAVVNQRATVQVAIAADDPRLGILPVDQGPGRAPTGIVRVLDAAGGVLCTLQLQEGATAAERSTASCETIFRAPGVQTLRLAYDGDDRYRASSSERVVVVGSGTPAVQLLLPGGSEWNGLSTIPVGWSVTGPSSGSVSVLLAGETVCTSSAMAGRCEVRVPASAQRGTATTLELRYSDPSNAWKPASAQRTGSVRTCVPFVQPSVTPFAGSATVALSAPDCGAGAGYLEGSEVFVTAQPAPGFTISGVNDGAWLDGRDGGAPRSTALPVARFVDGALLPMRVVVHTERACVPVTIIGLGLTGGADLNLLQWPSAGECAAPQWDGSRWSASFRVGTEVAMSYDAGKLPAHMAFAGWDDVADASRFAQRTSFTITPETTRIAARFSPVCYTGSVLATQPRGGTITVNEPARNCTDPRDGSTGWTHGTTVTGELVDDPASQRTFFQSWTTGRTVVGNVRTVTDAASGERVLARPFSYTITDDQPTRVGADYGRCVTLSTSVLGDASRTAPGSLTVRTASDCPLGAGTATAPWYRSGTFVQVEAKPSHWSIALLGWGGLDLQGSTVREVERFQMLEDRAITASFGSERTCDDLDLVTAPAGALDLDVSWSLGENACAALGEGRYDRGGNGNTISVTAQPVTDATRGADIVYAWTTSSIDPVTGGDATLASTWSEGQTLEQPLMGDSTVVAFACRAVSVQAAVLSPDGTEVPELRTGNNQRPSQSRIGEFVQLPRADCAGGGPASTGGIAWQAGSSLLPRAVADPAAYRFVGWYGDTTGKGATPDAAVRLVGDPRHLQSAYPNSSMRVHSIISARFQAVCHKLSVPYDTAQIRVLTAPNCPGMPASDQLYLGGTAVVLHADDGGSALFRHWREGTDSTDGRYASVVMDRDRTVIAYYSDRSLGENLSRVTNAVTDGLGVGVKKTLGFVTALAAAAVKSVVSTATAAISVMGYLGQALDAMGLEGSAADWMKTRSAAASAVIALLSSPLDCMTEWSAGGRDNPFYAAQNAFGSSVVLALSVANAPAAAGAVANPDLLDKLIGAGEQVVAVAAPVAGVAATAIATAQNSMAANASGSNGWESSARDAWGSEASWSVFSSCMSRSMSAGLAGAMVGAGDLATTGRGLAGQG